MSRWTNPNKDDWADLTPEQRARELRFDRYQFDPAFNSRRAGTEMDNALPAEFFGHRLSIEELDYDQLLKQLEEIEDITNEAIEEFMDEDERNNHLESLYKDD